MDAKEIKNIGKKLSAFLKQFDDCFYRSQPRGHLKSYVRGQVSSLQRKSAEPIALLTKTPPRTLQRFLSYVHWDEQRLRDRIQWTVAQDHAHPEAVGTVDDTGHPKKGCHTACVQRQWCGNTGKRDNCVVSVHIGYTCDDFQCLLDSDLYMPQSWADDMERRKEAGIPDNVVYRKKTQVALDQISHSVGNGICVLAWTFDELYGRDREFLDGLDALGQNYVGQVPSDFTGWLHEPEILLRPTPQQMRKRGPKRRFPRLSRKALPASEVRNLLVYSRIFQRQKWKKFHIKDGEKGPMVWEVKHAKFYRKHGENGLPGALHYLIAARNVLNPKEIKYFVSNMVPTANGISLEKLLWIAFSRAPIERCFEVGKRELGMDHFDVRGWLGIHRHFYISQLSYLFCSRVHQKLREKKDSKFISDGRAGSRGRLYLDTGSDSAAFGSKSTLSADRQTHFVLLTTQSAGPKVSQKKDSSEIAKIGCQNQSIELLCTA